MYEFIDLKRECEAIEIPSGIRRMLPSMTRVRISWTRLGTRGRYRPRSQPL